VSRYTLEKELKVERARSWALAEELAQRWKQVKQAEKLLEHYDHSLCNTCGRWCHNEDFQAEDGYFCINCWEEALYECPVKGCNWRCSEPCGCGVHGVRLERRG
jgi:hypothetical protein